MTNSSFSWHVGVAEEALTAYLLARCGFDVSVQYGANQNATQNVRDETTGATSAFRTYTTLWTYRGRYDNQEKAREFHQGRIYKRIPCSGLQDG